MKLSKRIQSIQGSATLAISAKANTLRAQGVDVISFSAGEPDFTTPEPILDGARRAMAEGRTGYTAVGGCVELKEAIRRYHIEKLGVEFSDAEIIASNGAKHSLFNMLLGLLDPGDEVILPTPAWVSYPTQIEMAGAKPMLVPGDPANGFVPTVADLEAATTERTTAIILNNPSNPTGAFWDADQLRGIASWLDDHPQVVVVSDSIYDELVYDGAKATELLTLAPHLRDRYILVNGFSKAFAMTGWRLGYALAPKEIVAATGRLQSQSTSNPNSIAQWGGIAALKHGESVIGPMRAEFEKRRDLIFGLLSEIPDLFVNKPRGAFYIFPDARAFVGRSWSGGTINDDMDLAGYLLDEGRIAVVPGGPFGAPGFFRMSYASSEDSIRAGCGRLAEALGRLG